MAYKEKSSIYAVCDKISERTKPMYEVDEQIIKAIGTDYRVIPTFETSVYEKVYINHYSLQRNLNLKCRWRDYVKKFHERVFAPFQFPDIRDFHFYNYDIRLLPGVSIHNMEHRMKVRPGPGVDSKGHLPIPQELMIKRGGSSVKKVGIAKK